MEKVEINKTMHLSEHFKLGEVTKSRHSEVYNIPSHVAIENLKRVCAWLEELRRRYNERYVFSWNEERSVSPPELGGVRGGLIKHIILIIPPAQFLQPRTYPFQILDGHMTGDVVDLSMSALGYLPERKVRR